MFGISRNRESAFLVDGKPLDQFPDAKTTVKLPHLDIQPKRSGELYALSQDLDGLDIHRYDGYDYHEVQVQLVPPSTISVSTTEQICTKCHYLNGRTFDGDSIKESPLKGHIRFRGR